MTTGRRRKRPERDSERPAVSSEELLKQAWASLGRDEDGDLARMTREERTRDSTPELPTVRNARQREQDRVDAIAAELARQRQDASKRRQQPSTQSQPTARSQTPAPPPPRPRTRPSLPERPRRADRPPSQEAAPQPTRAPQPSTPQPEPERRRRGAWPWLVLPVIWIASSIAGFFADDPADTTSPPVTVEATPELPANVDGELISVRAIQRGDCIYDLSRGEVISQVWRVPCTDEHRFEVYASFNLDVEYPGDELLYEFAGERCLDAFEGYVGMPFDADPELYSTHFVPTEEGWFDAGDRRVTCLVYRWPDDASEPVFGTESLRR